MPTKTGISHEELRRVNTSALLTWVHHHGPTTRARADPGARPQPEHHRRPHVPARGGRTGRGAPADQVASRVSADPPFRAAFPGGLTSGRRGRARGRCWTSTASSSASWVSAARCTTAGNASTSREPTTSARWSTRPPRCAARCSARSRPWRCSASGSPSRVWSGRADGLVHFAPNLGWTDVQFVDLLARLPVPPGRGRERRRPRVSWPSTCTAPRLVQPRSPTSAARSVSVVGSSFTAGHSAVSRATRARSAT